MTSLLQETIDLSIEHSIHSHPAWMGRVSGLYADKLLRDVKVPYQYVLRQGEVDNNYYVTFMQKNGTLKHQPFEITVALEGWYYENHGGGGPYNSAMTIDDVLHLIMHCQQGENTPYLL